MQAGIFSTMDETNFITQKQQNYNSRQTPNELRPKKLLLLSKLSTQGSARKSTQAVDNYYSPKTKTQGSRPMQASIT